MLRSLAGYAGVNIVASPRVVGKVTVKLENVPWEEAMRVPFILRWTGTIVPRQDNLLLSTPDICPTLLELMGEGDEIPGGVQGTSRASILLDGTGERPTSQFYIWIPYGAPALGRRGVRTHRYTLSIEKFEDGAETRLLFDNVEDPYQLVNLAERVAIYLAGLGGLCAVWWMASRPARARIPSIAAPRLDRGQCPR